MDYPHTATIRTNVQAGSKYQWTDGATVSCFIQPLSDSASQQSGLTFSKGYHCYLPLTAAVTEGMQLVSGGRTYGVRGLKTYDYGDDLAHKRALLELIV